MYNKIEMITEVKDSNKWRESFRSDNIPYIHERVAHDLLAKYMQKCRWILRMNRTQLYNGFEKIVVTYNNKCRNTYIVESR